MVNSVASLGGGRFNVYIHPIFFNAFFGLLNYKNRPDILKFTNIKIVYITVTGL